MKTVNHECYVSLEVAKLLIKAGFDWRDYFVAHSIDEHFHWEIPLHIAQRWLREVMNYDVFVVVKFLTNREYIARVETNISGYSTDIYKFYEEALEAGIKKALEIILERKVIMEEKITAWIARDKGKNIKCLCDECTHYACYECEGEEPTEVELTIKICE